MLEKNNFRQVRRPGEYSFIMPGCKKAERPGLFEIARPGPISAVEP
jgi:hypothetical protein